MSRNVNWKKIVISTVLAIRSATEKGGEDPLYIALQLSGAGNLKNAAGLTYR
ncbi:hypothetical protein [Paraburkholderia lycopersici]|uniref:hypothetical protein n=1 Tax=Paraburkholderia lycopersici TaxID=416944 RepID=UPI0015A1AC74|nr:hypothetical protein [Paraburkholderia lycopersici]